MNMSFYTAAVGAEQQQTRLDVLGNNIANVNNTGFCAKRPVFTALMYDFMDGVDGARLPRGSGAYMSSADSNFAAQAMPDTGRAQDYAIEGDGFFALWDPATEEYSYTRDGSFVVSMFTVPLEEGEEPELDADGNEILEKTVWYLSDGDGRFVLSNEGRLIEVEDQNAQQPVGVLISSTLMVCKMWVKSAMCRWKKTVKLCWAPAEWFGSICRPPMWIWLMS